MAAGSSLQTDEQGDLHPRLSTRLLGHEEAEAVLLRAYSSGRLPHAWMFTGPKGVGKATLAYRFARFLLHETTSEPDIFGGMMPEENLAPAEGLGTPADSAINHRITAGGHGDLVVLERSPDDKGKMRSVIPVDDVRKIVDFSHKTSAEGGWRVVIVDSLDDMNVNAVNALLKVLEEPPEKTVLLLVCHNPGAVLQTIHSRCCHLALQSLETDLVAEMLGGFVEDIDSVDAEVLSALSEGAPGKALRLWETGGLDLYRSMIDLVQRLPALDTAALYAFADLLASPSRPEAFKTGMELYLWWIGRVINMQASGRDLHPILEGELELMRAVGQRSSLEDWLKLWDKTSELTTKAERINLDKKQIVLTALADLKALVS